MNTESTAKTRWREGSQTKRLLHGIFVSSCLYGSLLFAADPIPVGPLEKRSLTRIVEQPGRIEPFAQTPLLVRIAGYVKAVHADIGDRVKSGQVLAELDVPEMEEELKQKHALVAQANAEVQQAEKLVAAAEANVLLAAAAIAEAAAARKRVLANYERWKSEVARVNSLVERKIIDEQTRDETLNQFRAAEAMREEVEAKVRSAEASKVESEAKRDKAIADVAVAKGKAGVATADEGRMNAMLRYAQIKAPFDGIVTARNVDIGHYLQPGKDAPLFVVTMQDPVRVFVDVREVDAPAIADKCPASVRVQGLYGRDFSGCVTRSSWSLDTKTRTLRTQIDLPNSDGALRPGMYAYGSITVTPPPTWTLPAAAIVKTADGHAAFIVRDGKATRIAVQIGYSTPTQIEILKCQSESGWTEPSDAERYILKAAGVVEGQSVAGK
jgi:multidrug efflux pump subunit AcrA (membrane-fusion protein)